MDINLSMRPDHLAKQGVYPNTQEPKEVTMNPISEIDWSFVETYEDRDVPWGPVGYVVYKRTYARKLYEGGPTEEWWQTIFRCCKSLVVDLKMVITQEQIEDLYDAVFNLKCSFSGRALWQLGTDTVRNYGADSLQNCWCVAVNEPINPFIFTFNQLMLGGGVGFNITPEQVYSIPKVAYNPTITLVDGNDVDFIVPDNREGWVQLLKNVLKSYYYTGKSFTYSVKAIRPKGEPISGFGGIASGPEALVKGITQICQILDRRYEEKLRPIDALDIMNIIGSIVVAGNVRRSAQIALGDIGDYDFHNSKAWGRHSIPNWRAMSNNTIMTDRLDRLPDIFWDNYTQVDTQGQAVSEPFGLFNPYNARRFGRLADGLDYKLDPRAVGCNPCAEITLESYEACNLAEIYLPRLADEEEFKHVAELMYMVTKTISNYPFSDPKVNEVVKRNHRLGIGVTGFLEAPHLRSRQIFNNVYRHIEEGDKEYSLILGINESIKYTTVKPSGTLSLLAGVVSGAHPAYAEYYMRRIRFAADDPLVEQLRLAGYPVENDVNFDGTLKEDTLVVSFPVDHSEAVPASKVTAVEQLEVQKWLQENWADNSVSVTIYYDEDELPKIREWLNANYNESVKTVSFLKKSNHGFKLPPLEEITQSQFEEMSRMITPLTRSDAGQRDLLDGVECVSGACPVK